MEPIELSIEIKEGIIDCRLEPIPDKNDFYEITILYPSSGNGLGRSEIFCNEMNWDSSIPALLFVDIDNEMHPKIKALENSISKAFINSLNNK